MEASIIGSIGDAGGLSLQDIIDTLEHPCEINRTEDFIGKPGTQLFVSDHYVLKLQNQFSIGCKEAMSWAEKQLDKERRYQIYHPSRTWVVLRTEDGCATANITRRLPVLAAFMEDEEQPASTRLQWLLRLFALYFHFMERHQLRQDEGLTNYAIDENRLWYLDDDIYQLDNGIGFSHSLAGFLRSLDFISESGAHWLGRALREYATAIGRNGADILKRNLMDTFMPAHREALRQGLVKGLSGKQKIRKEFDPEKPVAVIADIHANILALDAVLTDIRDQGIEQILVLGDIVGYGPAPEECVERLRETQAMVIRGNHDQAASDGETPGGFSRAASWSVPWTWQHLKPEQRQWLGELPLFHKDKRCFAVHGAPIDPTFMNAYVYARTSDRNLDYLQEQALSLCFHGHSHIAGCWWRDSTGTSGFTTDDQPTLNDGTIRLVCPGSVGQPRDGSHDACYIVWSPESPQLRWRHVDYDHQQLLATMREGGFPDFVLRLFE